MARAKQRGMPNRTTRPTDANEIAAHPDERNAFIDHSVDVRMQGEPSQRQSMISDRRYVTDDRRSSAPAGEQSLAIATPTHCRSGAESRPLSTAPQLDASVQRLLGE